MDVSRKLFLISLLWVTIWGQWQPAGGPKVSQIEPKSAQVEQTALLGSTVTKYVTPLPTFVGARVPAGSALAISYHEFQQKVLPDGFYDDFGGQHQPVSLDYLQP